MAGNLDKLTQAGVIADEKGLSNAERKVLEELGPEEVELLVKMRRKLDEATAADAGTSGFAGDPSPSVIV